jgi:FAD/FMN-containing dehydrogenase
MKEVFSDVQSRLLDGIRTAIGSSHVLTGADAAPWACDWTGAWRGQPLAVARPGTTAEIASVMRFAHEARHPVVPSGGRTGLTGASMAEGALVLSLDRMNRIRTVKPEMRLVVVEAGAVIDRLQEEADRHALYFPLTFGARGSATIGGALSTNAGGSNVLRYGSAREQCLGLEVVLADGRVLDLMSELHKDNSGYALRHLFIGAEGTLGVITAAVLKLVPKPRSYGTAMVAVPSISAALRLLGSLREATAGAVEAFEYMPRNYVEGHLRKMRNAREPFAAPYEHNIMVEVAAHLHVDAKSHSDTASSISDILEAALAEALESGVALDAIIARSEAQRREMWERREAAADITHGRHPFVETDVALPLDRVEIFLKSAQARVMTLDPRAEDFVVAHLGDGNVHYLVFPSNADPEVSERLRAAIDEEAIKLGGSFSAEHGVGLLKLASMSAHKNPVALETMRKIRGALDPLGILNPGKTIPAS